MNGNEVEIYQPKLISMEGRGRNMEKVKKNLTIGLKIKKDIK
jgi:hypothetical protein